MKNTTKHTSSNQGTAMQTALIVLFSIIILVLSSGSVYLYVANNKASGTSTSTPTTQVPDPSPSSDSENDTYATISVNDFSVTKTNSGTTSSDSVSNSELESTTDSDQPTYSSDYILQDSDLRYIYESDLESLTEEELSYAKNELYARHGRIFKDETIQAYFDSKSWYVGLYSPDEFDTLASSIFNEIEQENINTITNYIKRNNSN